MEGEADIKISKHSSGVSILIRLDQLWKNCHSYKRTGRYQMWCQELDSIWLELARDLFKKKEIDEEDPKFKKVKEQFDTFDDDIMKVGQIKDSAPEGFAEITLEDKKKRNEHYKLIMGKHEFLTRLENVVGKGTTYNEDEDDWD